MHTVLSVGKTRVRLLKEKTNLVSVGFLLQIIVQSSTPLYFFLTFSFSCCFFIEVEAILRG